MDNNPDNENAEVNTGGGTYVGKDVTTGRDFAGRDIHITNIYHSPAPTAQTEGHRASGKKNKAKPHTILGRLGISETIGAALIGAIATIGAVMLSYWLIEAKKPNSPGTNSPAAAIAQQAAPTATQAPPTATTVPPTQTPTLIPTTSTPPVTEAQFISTTELLFASQLSTGTPMPTTTSTPMPSTSTPTTTLAPTPPLTSTPGYPCLAKITSESGQRTVPRIYRDTTIYSRAKPTLTVGRTVEIRKKVKGNVVLYNIWSIEGAKQELGWIGLDDITLSSDCPKEYFR
jgi:cytoskeletal protein RodZ